MATVFGVTVMTFVSWLLIVTVTPPAGAANGRITRRVACRPAPTSGVSTSTIVIALDNAVMTTVSGALSTTLSLTTRRTV